MKPCFISALGILLLAPVGFAIVDTNDNGLSDIWERQQNNNELFPANFDPQDDPDQDGWTNAQEADAGTNPADPNPPDGLVRPDIISTAAVWGDANEDGIPDIITPEAITVAWPTIPGKQYTLLVSATLAGDSWLPCGVDAALVGDGDIHEFHFLLQDNDKLFWRVAVTDIDSDGDTLTDAEEITLGLDPNDMDTDDDCLTDSEELAMDLPPDDPDADDDGAPDGDEIAGGSDPKSSQSVPAANPSLVYEQKMIKGNERIVGSTYNTMRIFRQFPSSTETISELPGNLDFASLMSALNAYPYLPFTKEESGKIPVKEFDGFPVSIFGDGTIHYGPSLKILGLSHEITRPYGSQSNPTISAKAAGTKFRIENLWNSPSTESYKFIKFHIKAPMPNLPIPPEDTDETFFWRIPASSYVTVEEDTKVVELTLDQGEKMTDEIELAPPPVETGMCHLVGITPITVYWKEIDGFDNVDDHVDPWTNKVNGQRIFPDFKDPDDTEIRHKLEVIVTTSPALQGKPVFVRAFDVDDSTSESFDLDPESPGTHVIDENNQGGDNLPDYMNTSKDGQFWTGSAWGTNTTKGTVDANGETKFIFRVGMQPGNNYRIVASVIDDSMYAGVQTTDPAAAKYLGSEADQTGGAPATPLLTVWRRLWVENDSMEAIQIGAFGYKRNDLFSAIPNPSINGVFKSFDGTYTDFFTPLPSDDSSFKKLENGIMIVQSIAYPVIGTYFRYPYEVGDAGFASVRVAGDHSSVPLNSEFRLYDDDDFGLLSDPLPRQDLVNEQMKNYFKTSFVVVTDAAAFNSPDLVAFRVNEDVSVNNPSTVVDDKRNLPDKNECWVCTITTAYQGPQVEDQDPRGDDEGFLMGETAPHGDYSAGDYYDHSTVFVETCRECFEDGLRTTIPGFATKQRERLRKWIVAIASHEMGHQPGNQTDDHPEGGLMANQGAGISGTRPEDAKFSPKTILRFRKANRWSK